MARTTNDGVTAGQLGRFTPGQPDGLDQPAGGSVPGLPAIIFMTGGGTAANASPAGIGMDDKLNALTAAGYSIGQPNVPWALGGPGTTGAPAGTPGSGLVVTEDAINDCLTWMRQPIVGAVGCGCTMDPPILIGASNGWVCSITYARDFPVTGVIGFLPVTAGKDGYDDAALAASYDIHDRIAHAWNTNGVDYPSDGKYSPFDDIANYPDLRGKVQAWYACNDPLLVAQQMSFLQRPPIFAEMHNVGDNGHLGVLVISGELVTPDPVLNADTAEVVRFVDDLVAAL